METQSAANAYLRAQRADAQLSARVAADKSAVLLIQLPLGISLTEPVQLKVDNGTAERYPVQTCTNVGCIVNVPLKDPLMAALRSGTHWRSH